MENIEKKLECGCDPMPVGRWTINQDKCTTCCECIDVCPNGLLYLEEDVILIKNEHICNQCGDCVAICSAHAIVLT